MTTTFPSFATTAVALALAAGIALPGAVAVAQPAVTPQATVSPVTAGQLVDSSEGHTAWLSLPGSPLVLNPAQPGEPGSDRNLQDNTDSRLDVGMFNGSQTMRTERVLQTNVVDGASGGGNVAFSDDFSSAGGWSTAEVNGYGATITSDGSYGTVTLGSGNGWGGVEKKLTGINVQQTPTLKVKVMQTTGKWSLKLYVSGTADAFAVQSDTSSTGEFTYDLAQITGWTSATDFRIKIYQVGAQGSKTVFDSISLSGSTGPVHPADRMVSSWAPHQLAYEGTYPNGTVTTTDFFVSEGSIARVVSPTLSAGRAVTSGTFTAGTSYDANTDTITIPRGDSTHAIAVPTGAEVLFYPSQTAFGQLSGGAATPQSSGGQWALTPGQSGQYAMGVGIASGSDSAAKSTALAAALDARTAGAGNGLSLREQYWNAYLASVPQPDDFAIRAVDPRGLTPQEVRRSYYESWVGLRQNLIEVPGSGVQLASAKGALWNSGPAGISATSTWESPLAIQMLAYVDPASAWNALDTIVAAVPPTGALGTKNLPSRLAQTAWTVYAVTGDRPRLAGVWAALTRTLDWASSHLFWSGDATGESDERDAQFAASLLVDLDYATMVAEVLGDTTGREHWKAQHAALLADYSSWFFPGGEVTLQKVHLNGGGVADFGQTPYVLTGLDVTGLADSKVHDLLVRMMRYYGDEQQFAGLARDGIKTPDAQLITHGLIDHGYTDLAAVFTDATTRDIVRTGSFSGAFTETSNTSANPSWPSGTPASVATFATVIDNVWIMNGYRHDLGTAAFVRMPLATGGISGLTHGGRGLGIDIVGERIELSGPASTDEGSCVSIPARIGVVVHMADDCSQPPVHDASRPHAVTKTVAWLDSNAVKVGQRVALGVVVGSGGGQAKGLLTVRSGNRVLARVSTTGSSVIEIPAAALGAGTRRLSVSFDPSAGIQLKSSSTAVTLRVAKAGLRLKVKKAVSLKRSKRARLKIRVKGVARVVIAGRLTVYVGGKRVATKKVRVAGSASGLKNITVRTSKILHSGRVTVRYSGDANYVKKTYRTSFTVPTTR